MPVTEILLGAAVAIIMLRLYSLVRAMIWLYFNYESFYSRQQRRKKFLQYPGEMDRIYEATNGDYWPFGVRSYRLRKWAQGTSWSNFLLRGPLYAIQKAWSFYVFGPLCAVLMLVLSVWPGVVSATSSTLILTIVLLSMLCTIAIAAEAVISFRLLDSWTRHHYFGDLRDRSKRRSLAEISLYVGSLILALVISIAAMSVASVRYDGFKKIEAVTTSGGLELLEKFPAIVQVTLATVAFGGNGDPSNGIGQLVTILLYAQWFSYIFLGAAMLLSIKPLNN